MKRQRNTAPHTRAAQVGVAGDFVAVGTDNLLIAKGHKKGKEKYKAAVTGTAAGVGAAAVGTGLVATGIVAAPLAL